MLSQGENRHFDNKELKNYVGSAVVNNQIWITGGKYSGQYKKFPTYKDSILIGHDSSKPGADLPVADHGHCLANHKEAEQVYLLGGNASAINVWSISHVEVEKRDGHWNLEPNLSKGRFKSSCGVIADMEDPTISYVVIAGTANYDYVAEGQGTEIMKIGTDYFRTGPRLPFQIYYAASVASNNSLILLGGFSDVIGPRHELKTIMLFQCWTEDCQWLMLEQELIARRKSSVAILIPVDLLSC